MASVMDRMSDDMRDPAYRRQMERDQALETSVPEANLIGLGAVARGLIGRAVAARATPVAVPEIGSGIAREERIANMIRDRFKRQAKTPEEFDALMREHNLAKQAQREKELADVVQGNAAAKADRVASDALRTLGAEELAKRLDRQKKRAWDDEAAKREAQKDLSDE